MAALDNETNTAPQTIAEEMVTEELPGPKALVVAEEPVSEVPEEPLSSPAALVEDALETYEDKVTSRTADILSDADPTDMVRVLVRYDGDLADDAALSHIGVGVVEMTVAEAAALLESNDVDALEVDQPVELFTDMVPWGVERVGAPEVWNQTTGTGVAVGIVDTGIASHADLDIAGGTSVVGGSYADTHGHGTAVAGVVAAVTDSSGIVGVAPDVDLYAIKVMNGSSGQLSDIVAGIDWAIANDMDVLVMSFGTESYSQILEDALDDAMDSGMLLVAAAGNDGGDVRYPAAYDDVIAVGSTDAEDTIDPSSNTGSEIELVAPGVDVNTTGISDYIVLDGTSMAAPHVAGVAALVWAHNTSLSVSQVRNVLRSTAVDLGIAGRDDTYGYGLVQAVLNAGNSTPVNDSYFYEVWNITDYNTENETLTFWTNGTGTYEDLNFTTGYYHIVKHLDSPITFTLLVNENGSITLLLAVISWIDDYNTDGTGTDGITWEDGDLEFAYSDSSGDEDAMCINYSYNSNFETAECWGWSTTEFNKCRTESTELDDFCTDFPSKCHSDSGMYSFHMFPSTERSNIGSRNLRVRTFYACDSPGYQAVDTSSLYGVIDMKRTYCPQGYDRNYRIEGKVTASGSGTWRTVENDECSTSQYCDPLIARTYNATSETYNFMSSTNPYNPCRRRDGETCDVGDGLYTNDCLTGHYCVAGVCSTTNVETCTVNGTIHVSVDVEGSGYEDANVFVNSVSKGITDAAGLKQNIAITNVDCDADINVTIKCVDNTTICKTRTTQMDFQGDEDDLAFDCSLACGGTADLYLSQSSTWVNLTNKNITLTVWSRGITQSGVKVNISRRDYTGLIVNSTLLSVDVVAGQGKNVSTTVFQTLDAADYIHIWVDPTNSVSGEDNSNNYLFRPAVKPVSAYLHSMSVDPTYEAAETVIREYLGQYVELKSSPGEAVVLIDVGNWPEPAITGVGLYSPGGPITKPYGATVRGVRTGSQLNVTVRGIGVEGVLAGVKRLVAARSLFLVNSSGSYTSWIDDRDQFGIGVFDQLHAPEALTKFEQPASADFLVLVNGVLNDNNFEPAIKTVKTLNTTSYGNATILRVKHLNTEFTSDYKDAFSISEVPVVFSGGIFSSLETWEDREESLHQVFEAGGQILSQFTTVERHGLAGQMASEGWDVWEIEMNGGPTTDCDTCPNYRYEDLADHYWPASIAGITEYSGQNQIDYVGHSNGCRAALSALNNWSQTGKNNAGYYFDYTTGNYTFVDLPTNPVRRFVGVACPSVLDNTTAFTVLARASGSEAMQHLLSKNHVTLGDYVAGLLVVDVPSLALDDLASFIIMSALGDEKISYNLMNFYDGLAQEQVSTLDFGDVNVSKLYLHNGFPSDFVVHIGDANAILSSVNINATNEHSIAYNDIEHFENHVSIKSNPAVERQIKEELR